MFSQIEQTKFFIKLEKANTSLSKTLCGFLISMEKPTEDILSYIKSIYPSFTDHSFSHSLRILEKTYMILSKEFINELSTVEVFCFICASMFHDCGMAIPNCDDIEEQRKNHHLLVGQILKKFFDDNLNLLTFSKRIYNCVLFACESHNLDLDEFYNHEKFGIEETIDDCKVRFSLVAVLLRVGDLLDMDEERVYINTINALPYYFYKNNSLAHHERHLNIDSYHLGTNKIEIIVHADTKDEYYIWNQWFHYLENDIEKANTYLFNGDKEFLRFPPFHPTINHNLKIENLKFELDSEGQLIDIITNSIYTNEFDFLRELIQNAIDAFLKRIYLQKDNSLSHYSPRSWRPYNNEKPILVLYSQLDHRLIVSDSGVGMDSKDIKDYLFQLSNSGIASTNSHREFPFYSIAKFGIGFISCITRASKVSVYSKKENSIMSLVTLYANSIYAFFEESKEYETYSDDYNGTTIDLRLKNYYSFELIQQYLLETFRYTSVPIQYYNIDNVIDFSKDYYNTDLAKELFNKKTLTYKEIVDCFDQLQIKRKSLINEQNEKVRPYDNVYSNCISQYNILEKSYENNDYLSNKLFIEIIKSIITQFNMFSVDENSYIEDLQRIIVEIQGIDKNEFKKSYSYFIDSIYRCLDNLQTHIYEIRKSFINFPTLSSSINNAISEQGGVLLAHLDSNLNIDDVFINDLPAINNGTYLLIIRTSIFDYDKGVELLAWNGFIINSFENINRIERVYFNRGYNNSLYDDSGFFDKNINVYCDSDLYNELSYYDNLYDNTDQTLEEQIDYIDALEKDIIQVDVNDIVLLGNSKSRISRSYIDYQMISLETDLEKYNQPASDFIRNLHDTESVLYQDGIKLDVDISSLLPFGFCKCVANLTATSRFSLNITRHNISNNYDVINHWLKQTGNDIQMHVLNNIISTLKHLNCKINYEELVSSNSSKSLFSRLSSSQAKINRSKFKDKKD